MNAKWQMRSLSIAIWLNAGSSVATGAAPKPEHPYRCSVLDIPVTLAKGTVRTPGFTTTKTQYYWVMIQVQKITLFEQLNCWLTTTEWPLDGKDWCTGENDRLLQAEWSVWRGDRKIASGTNENHGYAKYTAPNVFKLLGNFPAKRGQSYTLQVTFMKDSSPIDVNNPHLIVVPVGDE